MVTAMRVNASSGDPEGDSSRPSGADPVISRLRLPMFAS
jgi:uncharacterized membrane protein